MLPDSKVVSGSEGGFLLLWDGGLIKTTIGCAEREGHYDAQVFPVLQHQATFLPTVQTHRPAARGAHVAGIWVVIVDAQLGTLMTGGDDGALRWWDLRAVMSADTQADGVTQPGLVPLAVAHLGVRGAPRAALRLGAGPAPPSAPARWLITDAAGLIWSVEAIALRDADGAISGLSVSPPFRVYQGPSGALLALAASHVTEDDDVATEPEPETETETETTAAINNTETEADDVVATGGFDGCVRAYSRDGVLLASRSFRHALDADTDGMLPQLANSENAVFSTLHDADAGCGPRVQVTSALWASKSLDPSRRTLFVGFADGSLRALWRGDAAWALLASTKPHESTGGGVRALAASTDGSILVTVGGDGTAFFFAPAVALGAAQIEAAHAPDSASGDASRLRLRPLGFLSLSTANGGLTTASICTVRRADGGWAAAFGAADGAMYLVATPPPPPSRENLGGWADTSRSLDLGGTNSACGVASIILILDRTDKAPPPPPLTDDPPPRYPFFIHNV